MKFAASGLSLSDKFIFKTNEGRGSRPSMLYAELQPSAASRKRFRRSCSDHVSLVCPDFLLFVHERLIFKEKLQAFQIQVENLVCIRAQHFGKELSQHARWRAVEHANVNASAGIVVGIKMNDAEIADGRARQTLPFHQRVRDYP